MLRHRRLLDAFDALDKLCHVGGFESHYRGGAVGACYSV